MLSAGLGASTMREQIMRPIVLGLITACALSLPAFAAEPDGPSDLINQPEALRIAVQGKLAEKNPARKTEQVALLDYYSVPDQPLLWVDENGLNARAKSAMAELAKADDYGLRASDYALPKPDEYNPLDAKAADWLADAEVKLSYAVLDYSADARGGRLDPQRISGENLDPTLTLPNPAEVLGSIAIRSGPTKPGMRPMTADGAAGGGHGLRFGILWGKTRGGSSPPLSHFASAARELSPR